MPFVYDPRTSPGVETAERVANYGVSRRYSGVGSGGLTPRFPLAFCSSWVNREPEWSLGVMLQYANGKAYAAINSCKSQIPNPRLNNPASARIARLTFRNRAAIKCVGNPTIQLIMTIPTIEPAPKTRM